MRKITAMALGLVLLSGVLLFNDAFVEAGDSFASEQDNKTKKGNKNSETNNGKSNQNSNKPAKKRPAGR